MTSLKESLRRLRRRCGRRPVSLLSPVIEGAIAGVSILDCIALVVQRRFNLFPFFVRGISNTNRPYACVKIKNVRY